MHTEFLKELNNMKRLFAASLSFLMVLALLLALPAPAFAAVPAVIGVDMKKTLALLLILSLLLS